MTWFRRIGGAVSTRVLTVVIIAGAVPLTLASVGITWLVADDKEAVLVEEAVAEASATRAQIEHATELALAQLRGAALAAADDRVLAVPEVVGSPIIAVRCDRDGLELLRAAAEREASELLERESANVGEEEALYLLPDRDHAIIRTQLEDVHAVALLDLRSLLTPPSGWRVELRSASGGGPAGLVAERSTVDGRELVTASAVTKDGLRVELIAPIAPARAAAGHLVRDVVAWSSLALLPLLVLGFVMARRVTAPVRQLAGAVRRATGPVRIPPLPANEIGDLGNAIAAMSDRLHEDARVLRCAVRFARRVHRLTGPDHLLNELEGLLEEAFPQRQWHVLSESSVEHEASVPTIELPPSLLAEAFAPAPRYSDEPGESSISEFGSVRTFESEGHCFLTLSATADPFAVAVARGPIDGSEVRMAELLCRTAASALANQELQLAAVNDEKLRVLGRLAAGVAHEMNNPLAFVAANLKMLEEALDGELLEMARDAREGTDRLARIVSDMSSISLGGRSDQREPHSVDAIVRSAVKVARSRRAEASIVISGADSSWVVECDRLRIEQIILNLVVNAIDAVPEGRRPTVEVRIGAEEHQLTIDVADNGSGIGEDVLGNIFDPFFTTKGRRGTGLGLFLSRSFAEADGGSLSTLRTGRDGTTFRLAMPLSEAELRSSREEQVMEPSRSREVLVVDDEPAIVRAMTRLLGRYGSVTGSTDPRSALDLVRNRSFSFVICDLNMPYMSGLEFREALRVTRPDLAEKVIFMSGAVDPDCDAPVIQKPIDPVALRRMFDGA